MIVEVPGQGEIEFPDSMSDADVTSAIKKITGPKIGMGDVQAAPSSWAGSSNVPAAMLTGDPETDNRIGQNLAAQGGRKTVTKGDALRMAVLSASLAPMVANPIGAAAISGGLFSGATSKADDAAGIAGDALVGAGTGAAAGAALKTVGGPLAQWLAKKGQRYGAAALTGISSIARKKAPSPEAVEQAFKVGAIRPGSTVEGIARRLQDAADPLAQRYGEILTELEAKGVTGPNAQRMAAQFAQEAATADANSIVGTRAKALGDTASALTGTPGGHMTAAIPPKPTLPGGELSLMQTELMKRELQADAASQYVKEGPTSLAGGAKKEIAGKFRQAIEDAVSAQSSKAPAEAAAFMPVKEELHRTLEGLGFAREGAARYARRNPFGLHEAMGLASGVASGNPLEAIGTVGAMHALKDRGTSTLASLAHGGAKALGAVPQRAVPGYLSAPVAPKTFAQALAEALRRIEAGPVPVPADEGDR